jgi:trimethylamine--corrinoid protein Co-methyltransferase
MRLKTNILSSRDIVAIHETVLGILKDVGLQILDEDAVMLLRDSGCRLSAEGFVRFDPDLVTRALATVPRRFVLYDRSGAIAVDSAAVQPCFAPGINCLNVLDHRTGKLRPCLLSDVREAAHLCQALPNIHMAANLGNPSDLAPEDQAMASVKTLLDHTQKPLAFIAHDEAEANRIWQLLAAAAGGWSNLIAKPFAMDLTGPTSPLMIKAEACRRLIMAARNRLPLVWYPCLFPGLTGPMTLAGALAQSAAEIIGGVVIHQRVQPGAPILTGSAVVPIDMRTVQLAYGGPQYALIGLAACAYFEAVGIPTWIGAGCSDAHTMDSQAAAEAGVNMLAAALSPTAFIHNLGFLSGGKTGSLEMLVLCNELAGMVTSLVQGLQVDATTLAMPVIAAGALAGGFVKHPHTRAHVAKALWAGPLFTRTGLAGGFSQPDDGAAKRIRARLAELLED